MGSVGVRELRDALSAHLAKVREGHTITVTDHGRPVARIVPVGEPTKFEQLVASGRVTLAPRRKGIRPAPAKLSGTVSGAFAPNRGHGCG